MCPDLPRPFVQPHHCHLALVGPVQMLAVDRNAHRIVDPVFNESIPVVAVPLGRSDSPLAHIRPEDPIRVNGKVARFAEIGGYEGR